VTGSEKSPDGGLIAPMTVTEPMPPAERLDDRCALVEVRDAAREIRGISAFAGQLAEPPRDLAQRLGPSGSSSRHQRDVQALSRNHSATVIAQ
jgi:hypothetical protein